MSTGEMPSIHPALALIFLSEEQEDLNACASWRFFSHSLRRNPANLKLHVQRIFFAIQHEDSIYLAGSLHDLFYVLKDAGKNLRLRLLKASAPYLNENDKKYYAAWVQAGEECGMSYKWVKGSVLSPGLYATDQVLITAPEKTGVVTLSPLEEARACMEFGQLDVAKKILEDALSKDPDNVLIKEELEHVLSYSQKTEEIQAVNKNEVKSTLGNKIKKFKDKLFNN